jgi:hypothetical protein
MRHLVICLFKNRGQLECVVWKAAATAATAAAAAAAAAAAGAAAHKALFLQTILSSGLPVQSKFFRIDSSDLCNYAIRACEKRLNSAEILAGNVCGMQDTPRWFAQRVT